MGHPGVSLGAMGEIEALIFDMDGTLLDTERVGKKAWTQAARELGFEFPDGLYVQLIGQTIATNRPLLEREVAPYLDLERLIERCNEIYRDLTDGELPKKVGVMEVLQWVDEEGLPRAVGTSTSRAGAERKLGVSGLREWFPVIACGDEVEEGKPAPDIFLLAAERVGVDPRKCVVLEDSPAGVSAAVAAGMVPVMIPDMLVAPSWVREAGIPVLESMLEFPEWVQSFAFGAAANGAGGGTRLPVKISRTNCVGD